MIKDKSTKKDKESTTKDDNLNQQLLSVLSDINKLQHIIHFQKPVDTKANPHYLNIIKNPMDLSKIKRNIKKNVYTSRQQFIDDINQIWKNCQIYNQDGSDFYVIASVLDKKCQKIFNKHFNDKKSLSLKKNKSYSSNMETINDVTQANHKDTLIILKTDKIFQDQQSEMSKQSEHSLKQQKQKEKEKSARKQEKLRLKQEKLERRLAQQLQYEQQEENLTPQPLLSQNPMNEEQKQKIMECLAKSDEETLYKMIKVVDKYENYMVQQIPNKNCLFQFNVSLKSLDQRTIQKMIEVAQGKNSDQQLSENDEDKVIENKIKQEEYEMQQLALQQQMIIEKIQN